MNILYMLDTNICSYIMRKHPFEVLQKMTELVKSHNSIVISAVTYEELKFSAIGKKANRNHSVIVDNFMDCVDMVFPWDRSAVDATVQIRKELSDKDIIIGSNNMAIAGTAISTGSVLVTNNIKNLKECPVLSTRIGFRGTED